MDTEPLKALKLATEASEHAEITGDPKLEREAIQCRGTAEERTGAFPEFMRSTLLALGLSRAMGDPAAMAEDLQNLSVAYHRIGLPDKAVEEARNALAMILPTQRGQVVLDAQRFLLETLLQAGMYDEVLQTAEQFRQKVTENPMEEARLGHLTGRALLAQHKYSDAHTYLSGAQQGIEAAGTKAEQFQLITDVAEAYIGLGNFKKASQLLVDANERLTTTDTWKHRDRITELKYELAIAEGRWEDALTSFKLLKERTDSLNDARLDMQLARMQVTYELDRKEQDNAELRNENAMNAELIEGTQWNNRILLFALLVLAGCAISLLLITRRNIRMARRLALKNAVVKKQHDEIHSKNLEMKRQNMRLAETLVSEEEKEMVIKEIHHRVKNNLQVVDSLLNIQGMESDDPNVGRVLKEAQGRIRSMALVHEQIYRSASQTNLDLQQHLQHLVRSILVAYGAHDRISVSVEAKVPPMEVETLMPLTLVVNELFTNSVKYAFRDDSVGRITVMVRHAGAGFELLFSDDGVGMEDPILRERSFGMELVRVLATQLNGEVHFLKGHGTTVSMTFNPDRASLRVAS